MNRKKKQLNPSPNPLFYQWLHEMKEAATEKKLKTQFGYAKALRTLKKYPLLLKTGKECKLLDGFGDKICKYLDERLEEYISTYDSTSPVDGYLKITYTLPITGRSRKRKISDKTISIEDNLLNKKVIEMKVTPCTDTVNMESASLEINDKYIPRKESGGYAILLALLENTKNEKSLSYLSKEDLIKNAQPFSIKSFTIPESNTRYTAWSSMKTLIKRNLVVKSSCPAKYSLTNDGYNIAKRMTDVIVHDNIINFNQDEATTPVVETKVKKFSPVLKKPVFSCLENNKTSNGTFLKKNNFDFGTNKLLKNYNFEDKYGNIVFNSDETLSLDSDSESSLIEFVTEIPGIKNEENFNLPINDANSLNKTSPEKDEVNIELKNHMASDLQSDDDLPELEVLLKKPLRGSVPFPSFQPNNTNSMLRKSNESSNNFNAEIPVKPPKSLIVNEKYIPELSIPCDEIKPTILFTLKPGEFDVILIVDNSEHYGNQKETIVKYLKKHKIQTEIRCLNIGDFLWIAKEKSVLKREVVLDYIIERKRMDDLASSICDGRYKEQKFRLKKCSIKNLIYVIENYGSVVHFSINELALQQAITNTQFIDDFFIKKTSNLDDTASYLACMTNKIMEIYSKKQLNVYSIENIENIKISQNDENCCITFNEFNQSSLKTKPLSANETFIKHLMQVSGVTLEKCLAIVKKCSTIANFIKSINSYSSITDQVEFVANIKYGSTKKNIGKVLAHQLVSLYTTNT